MPCSGPERRAKLFTAAAIAAGLVGVGAVTASAAGTDTSGDFGMATEGAAFYGFYEFYPNGVRHGAFHFTGNLDDLLDDDDHVYAEVSVEGYGPRTYRGGADLSTTPVEGERWDHQATRTDHAYLRVCRDTGFPVPNNCSARKHYAR